MNITFMKLKPVIAELRGIRKELSRLAECWEAELANEGMVMRPGKADTSGPEPTLTYVDEELDYVRETVERYQREDERLAKEEE